MSAFILQSVEALEEPEQKWIHLHSKVKEKEKEALESGAGENLLGIFNTRLFHKRSEITLYRFAGCAAPMPDSGLTPSEFTLLFRLQVCVSTGIGAIRCGWRLLWASFYPTAPLSHISQPVCQTCLCADSPMLWRDSPPRSSEVFLARLERDRFLPDKRGHSGAVCHCAARLRVALIKANLPATRTTEGESEEELLLLPPRPPSTRQTICKFMTPE